MFRIINTLYAPLIFLKLFRAVRFQKKFIATELMPFLKSFADSDESALTPEDIYKITHYYGMGVPAIIGSAIAILRNKPLSVQERRAATFCGALTGLGDDFFDNRKLNPAELESLLNALIDETSDYLPQNSREELFIQLFRITIQNTSDKDAVKMAVVRVFKAQTASLRQYNPDITDDEIRRITDVKGGASLLLYRSLFENSADTIEQNFIFQMGALMQLGNDIFDIYSDTTDGVHTLANRTTDIAHLRSYFENQLRLTFNDAYQTNYSKRKIKTFLRFISMGISRVFVCLDMLARLQKNNNNVFKPASFSRKQLICDMEKPANLLRSIQYYINLKP